MLLKTGGEPRTMWLLQILNDMNMIDCQEFLEFCIHFTIYPLCPKICTFSPLVSTANWGTYQYPFLDIYFNIPVDEAKF